MLVLRSLLYTLGMWLLTPIYALIAILTFPLPPIWRYQIISGWARSMLWWLRVTCDIRYRIIGQENIPATPSIILAKHQSAWETLAFQQIFPPQVWVLKRELLWIPFFGWGLAMTSPIAINRSAGREALKQMVAQGKDRLKKGFWVVIFPEGTRMAPSTKGKYHIGGAWLATHTQSNVVPVAHNAGTLWPKNSFIKKPGTITVHIGPVIASAGLKPDELNQRVEAWIESAMADLPASNA
ncbi:1-acyl-sn-glycerol-3-phosphate acyltransferase [Methylovorus menthalis]|uniref:lysophospholipid acyltransferase family protein n=1 Tax=Methylovorus menthalis TaxID=1002227 RepID=UPI001E5C3D6B|nr:lysophospholipid acyltransferase family protein [Methylovorus menthalis]MCB4811129.1 1-acyl-sn-glycerol-3-phosphate acyltransferase [Methylovorus menthalis]